MTALVFLDTETTGLNPEEDEIWEFAAIRRRADGSETQHNWFIKHNQQLVTHLPEQFRADHNKRYREDAAITHALFESRLNALFSDKPRIIGACPWFDTAFLAQYITPCWNHRLIDVETLTTGHTGILINGLTHAAAIRGITNPAPHTAIGDTITAMRIYDTIMT